MVYSNAIKYFFKAFNPIAATDNLRFSLGKNNYIANGVELASFFTKNFMTLQAVPEMAPIVGLIPNPPELQKASQEVFTAVLQLSIERKEQLAEKKKKLQQEGKLNPTDQIMLERYDSFGLVSDIYTAERKFIEKDTLRVTDLHIEPFEKVVSGAALKAKMAEGITAVFKFDPRNPSKVYEEETELGPTKVFNTFVRPEWMDNRPEKLEFPDIDFLIKRLMPHKECQEYFLSWSHHALTSRAETVLQFTGGKATGKTMLAEEVFQPLFGDYFWTANESFLKKEFNYGVKNKLMAFNDEAQATTEQAHKIKMYINNTISVEGKGKEAEMVTNHASFFCVNNSRTGIPIEQDDRRYSIPFLTNKKLSEVYSYKEIAEFRKRLREQAPAFGHFLLEYTPKYTAQEPYHSETFFSVLRANLHVWQSKILEIFFHRGDFRGLDLELDPEDDTHEGITFDEFSDEYTTKYPRSVQNTTKISEFFKTYNYKGKRFYIIRDSDGKEQLFTNPDFNWSDWENEFTPSLKDD